MKNFKITAKENGKEYWISRAHAVVGIVYAVYNEEIYYLVSQRGPGCPDNIGKWACTCGYLDWGETRKEAVKRELYEELGLNLSEVDNSSIKHFCTIDDPGRDARENIISRYLIKMDFEKLREMITSEELNNKTESRGGEKDEVSKIALIPETQLKCPEWAFNHGQVLEEVTEYLKTGRKPYYCEE